LDRTLSAISVGRPRTDDTSDECTSAIDAIESSDDVGCVSVALLALWCKIKICVDYSVVSLIRPNAR